MSLRLALGVVAAVPVLAVAQPVTCERFAVKATLQGAQLTVALDTDLPDFTRVMVSVSRSYWQNASEAKYSLDYLRAGSTVGEWRRPRTIDVGHGVWRRALEDHQRVMAAVGDPIKVRRTSDQVEASFTVPVNQPNPRFGAGNANLTGKCVQTRGMRVARSEARVSYPLGSAGATGAEFGAPLALKVRNTYQLSKATPLMPERKPSDPLAALEKRRSLPPGTRITVLSVDVSDAAQPWYNVRATAGAAGAILGTGWINSGALIAQELRLIRP